VVLGDAGDLVKSGQRGVGVGRTACSASATPNDKGAPEGMC
jgi:hypothetical protein